MCASKGGRTNGTRGGGEREFLGTFGSAPIFHLIFFANGKIFVSRFHTVVVVQGVWLFCCFSLCYGRVAIRTCRPVSSFSISCNAVDNQKRYGPKTFSPSDFVSIFLCVRLRVILFFSQLSKKRFQSHAEQTVTVRRDFVEPVVKENIVRPFKSYMESVAPSYSIKTIFFF